MLFDFLQDTDFALLNLYGRQGRRQQIDKGNVIIARDRQILGTRQTSS